MMQTKSSMIRARIKPTLKKEVDKIFEAVGLTTTQAITLFYYHIKLIRGIPFPIRLPNQETRETFEKTDRGEELIACHNEEDLFHKLGI